MLRSVLAAIGCAGLLLQQLPADGEKGAKLREALDATVKQSLGTVSAAVLVARNGELLLHAGYGTAVAALEGGEQSAVDRATVFAIGSITKLFTAAAVLKLEQQGRLTLEDRLGELLDGVPADKAAITLHQLLTHSAGFQDFHDRPGEGGDFAPLTKDEALTRILEQKLLFAPGSESRYSNSGYTLLAGIVEEASGRPFAEYLRDELFTPAGMSRTGFFGEARWKPEEIARGRGAKRHAAKGDQGESDPGRVNNPMQWELTWALVGNGGMVSSVEDLWKWSRALDGDVVLDAAHRAKLEQAQFPLPEGGAEGYGWMIGKTSWGSPMQNMAGGDDFGFLSELWRAPKEGIFVVVTSNSTPPRGTLPNLMEKLARAVHDAGTPVPGENGASDAKGKEPRASGKH